jgi:hypothetical protein
VIVEVIGPGNQHTEHLVERLRRIHNTSDASVKEGLIGFEGHFVHRMIGNTAIAYKRMVQVWTEHNDQPWPFINIVCHSEEEAWFQHNKNRLSQPANGNGNRATLKSNQSIMKTHAWWDFEVTFLVLTSDDAAKHAPSF